MRIACLAFLLMMWAPQGVAGAALATTGGTAPRRDGEIPEGPVLLRYRYDEDAAYEYTITHSESISDSTDGLPEAINRQAALEAGLRLHGKGHDDEGFFLGELEFHDLRVRKEFARSLVTLYDGDGQHEQSASGHLIASRSWENLVFDDIYDFFLRENPVTVTIADRLGVAGTRDLKLLVRDEHLPLLDMQLALGGVQHLPDEPVTVGDSWKVVLKRDVLNPGTGKPHTLTLEGKLEYTAAGWATMRGRRCIKLEAKWQADAASLDKATRVLRTTEGTIHLDAETGVLVESSFKVVETVTWQSGAVQWTRRTESETAVKYKDTDDTAD